MEFERTQQLKADLAQIPRHRIRKKRIHTAIGLAICAFAFVMPWIESRLGFQDDEQFPVMFRMLLFGLGAFMVSKSQIVDYLRFVPAALRDILGGRGGDG